MSYIFSPSGVGGAEEKNANNIYQKCFAVCGFTQKEGIILEFLNGDWLGLMEEKINVLSFLMYQRKKLAVHVNWWV